MNSRMGNDRRSGGLRHLAPLTDVGSCATSDDMKDRLRQPVFMGFTATLLILFLVSCGSSRQEVQERLEKGRYHYNLAYGHYFDASRPNADAALHEVLKSLQLHPEYPEAHMLAGLIFLGREMHLQAIKHLKRAVELKPEFYAAQNNLGAAYIAASRWNDAISVYDGLVGNLMYSTPGHGTRTGTWRRRAGTSRWPFNWRLVYALPTTTWVCSFWSKKNSSDRESSWGGRSRYAPATRNQIIISGAWLL